MPLNADIGKAYAEYYTHDVGTDELGHRFGWRNLYWRFFDRVADSYLSTVMGYHHVSNSRWRTLLARLAWLFPEGSDIFAQRACYLNNLADGARVLDVGCGSGADLARLRDLGWSTEGLEFDHRAAEAARLRGLHVREGELSAQRYPSQTFDAVILSHVIEHVHDPVDLLSECSRILRPGGKVVILTPNADSLGHRYFGKHWRGLEVPRHLMIFTSGALGAVVTRAGLVPVQIRTSARISKFIWWMSVDIWRRSLPDGQMKKPNLNNTLLINLFLLAERLLSLFRFGVGEELIVVAQKPLAPADLA
jgi:SAM-dependent methyltransferase